MLDGQSCVFRRTYPSSCDPERDCYFSSCSIEMRRGSDGEQEAGDGDAGGPAGGGGVRGKRRRIRPFPEKSLATSPGLSDSSAACPSDDRSDQQESNYSTDGALINGLNRDMSINCLVRCSRSDYGSISSLSRSFNSLVRSGLLYRLRREHGIVEHWVYFACSLAEWQAFDPYRQRWMRLPRIPSGECFTCSDKESLAVGTELLVFGKDVNSVVIWRYSILTNSWSPGPSMESPRCLFGSASLGEIAIVAGGCDINGRIFSSAEMYNSEKGRWVALPSMNSPRKMCSGFFMDGKFYVIGGLKSLTEPLTCGEELDLKTKTWRTIPDMSPCKGELAGAPPWLPL